MAAAQAPLRAVDEIDEETELRIEAWIERYRNADRRRKERPDGKLDLPDPFPVLGKILGGQRNDQPTMAGARFCLHALHNDIVLVKGTGRRKTAFWRRDKWGYWHEASLVEIEPYILTAINKVYGDRLRSNTARMEAVNKMILVMQEEHDEDEDALLRPKECALGDFDQDMNVIGMRNGAVQIRVDDPVNDEPLTKPKLLSPAETAPRLIRAETAQSTCRYDPSLTTEQRRKLLMRVYGHLPHAQFEWYFDSLGWQAHGYHAKRMYLWHGPTGAGKSTLFEGPNTAFGAYFEKMDIEEIGLHKKDDKLNLPIHPPVRWVWSDEVGRRGARRAHHQAHLRQHYRQPAPALRGHPARAAHLRLRQRDRQRRAGGQLRVGSEGSGDPLVPHRVRPH